MPCKRARIGGAKGLHGMQEVAGSSPASSIRRTPANVGVSSFEGSEFRIRITAIVQAPHGSGTSPVTLVGAFSGDQILRARVRPPRSLRLPRDDLS
jgi:hypothetical protein